MLIVCLPGGATEGLCKINARPCDFRIVAGEFWYRPQASTEGWDKRKILATVGPRPDGQVCYSCSNSVRAPEPEPEPATITTKCSVCGRPIDAMSGYCTDCARQEHYDAGGLISEPAGPIRGVKLSIARWIISPLAAEALAAAGQPAREFLTRHANGDADRPHSRPSLPGRDRVQQRNQQ